MGTAGAVRWALRKQSGTTILLLNGDSYCDVNLAAFRHFHDERAAEVSLVLVPSPRPLSPAGERGRGEGSGASRFGKIWVDSHDRVKRFQEKTDMPGSAWINAGIYLLQRRLVEEIPVE